MRDVRLPIRWLRRYTIFMIRIFTGDIVIKTPVAGNPSVADICEQGNCRFENTMQEEAVALSWEWGGGWRRRAGDMNICRTARLSIRLWGQTEGSFDPVYKIWGNTGWGVATHSTCKSPVTKRVQGGGACYPRYRIGIIYETRSVPEHYSHGNVRLSKMGGYPGIQPLLRNGTITRRVRWSGKNGDQENTDFPGDIIQ